MSILSTNQFESMFINLKPYKTDKKAHDMALKFWFPPELYASGTVRSSENNLILFRDSLNIKIHKSIQFYNEMSSWNLQECLQKYTLTFNGLEHYLQRSFLQFHSMNISSPTIANCIVLQCPKRNEYFFSKSIKGSPTITYIRKYYDPIVKGKG